MTTSLKGEWRRKRSKKHNILYELKEKICNIYIFQHNFSATQYTHEASTVGMALKNTPLLPVLG